jgi:hypothetical protein
MKEFLVKIFLIMVFSFVILEILVRVAGIAGIRLSEENINNNRLYEKNFEGVWAKGGLGEIKSNVKINNQGWNSIKNYEFLPKNKINVAIIGDSYIEGFHENVENSIGRRLENVFANTLNVHEFGHSGGNINDYLLIYNSIKFSNYNKIIILVSNADFKESQPSFMGKGKEIPGFTSLPRIIYNSLNFIKYLNVNLGLLIKMEKVFERKPHVVKNIKNENLDEIRFDFSVFDNKEVVFLYEKEKFNSEIIDSLNFDSIAIKHVIKPNNFGFDSHWNTNGRINCVNSIADYFRNKGF